MNLSNPMNVRPAYYDRNPTNAAQAWVGSGIGPHGGTVRLSYTVPARRKAFLSYTMNENIRKSAATTAGQVVFAVYETPYGGSSVNISVRRVTDNTVDKQYSRDASMEGILLPGDAVYILTADYSTGGTNDYSAGLLIIEFDQ